MPACEPQSCETPAQEPDRRADFFSVDYGDAHVVVLDLSRDFRECSQQLDWLCRDLSDAQSRGMTWLIVAVHHHPFTTGSNDMRDCVPNDPPPPARILLPPIFDRFGVDLVLSGHDHNYQRSLPLLADDGANRAVVSDAQKGPFFSTPTGTIYVVTGGGGTRTYPIFCEDRPEDRPERELFHVAVKAHHAVEMIVSKDFLEVREVDTDGTQLDYFKVSKTPAPLTRGDANFDGAINITDAVSTLHHLFVGRPLACPEAANVRPEDSLGINDAVSTLEFLFRDGAAPAPPFPECDVVPGVTRLNCPCTCGEGC